VCHNSSHTGRYGCQNLSDTGTHIHESLQHTAAHCNTLQHTATHCNTLQHTATHCNTLQHAYPRVIAHIHRNESCHIISYLTQARGWWRWWRSSGSRRKLRLYCQQYNVITTSTISCEDDDIVEVVFAIILRLYCDCIAIVLRLHCDYIVMLMKL